MNSAIIVAGGKGERARTKIPKQFFYIIDKMRIIDYSINLLQSNSYIDEIILVVPRGWEEKIAKENPNCKIIIGGNNRTESVFRGLKFCSKDSQSVIIHDAVRPFINHEFINNIFINLLNFDAVIPATTNFDSVIKIADHTLEYINRDNIKFIQTPQGFNYNIIFDSYNNNNNKHIFPDDMSLLLSMNNKIDYFVLDGLENNFKITSNNDMHKARKILKK
jgi:2-C-methyl-D-erythritol 4-phosphate cytidylyltransferase